MIYVRTGGVRNSSADMSELVMERVLSFISETHPLRKRVGSSPTVGNPERVLLFASRMLT